MQVHLVKTRLVNSYVVEYADKLLVIDVASGCHRYVLGFITETLKRQPEDVALVCCTHDDPDHIGGVKALAKLCHSDMGIPYASGSLLRKTWHDPTGMPFRFVTSVREALRPRAWKMYANAERNRHARQQAFYSGAVKPATDARARLQLKGGYTLPGFDDWQLVHTPGHSWDSCCFYHQTSDSLVSGDCLLGSAQQGQLVTPAIYSNPIQMRRTLRHLKSLKLKKVYPGHGSIITGENLLA